jgi:hypothetical protein
LPLQACYAFYLSKMATIDEIYSRDKHCNLTYIDFLEARRRAALPRGASRARRRLVHAPPFALVVGRRRS